MTMLKCLDNPPIRSILNIWQIENLCSLSCQNKTVFLVPQAANIDAFTKSIIPYCSMLTIQFIPVTSKNNNSSFCTIILGVVL